MIRGIKVKLYPNKEQEILFKKSCGLARYAYNWGLKRIIRTEINISEKEI